MAKAYLVLRKHTDGTHGLLNIVEGSGPDDHAAAIKLMVGWQTTLPEATLAVKLGEADKCKPVNNHDGFIDKPRKSVNAPRGSFVDGDYVIG